MCADTPRPDLTGRCLCGAVRLRVENPPTEIGACHCGMCRRWTGVAFLAITVPPDRLTVEGRDAIRVHDSSAWARRAFCGTCGSCLWYQLRPGIGPDDCSIAAGLFDDLSGMRLTSEIFIDHKPTAFAFEGPTIQMTEAEFLTSINASPEE